MRGYPRKIMEGRAVPTAHRDIIFFPGEIPQHYLDLEENRMNRIKQEIERDAPKEKN